MATIDDVIKNFQSLHLEAEVPRIIQKLSAEMVDYNLHQLEMGLTSDGITITPRYRNAKYAAFKNTLDPTAGYGVPNLKLTGDFYAGFHVQLKGMVFEFGSRDSKSALLEGVYGKNGGIFGLTEGNKGNFAQDDVRPELFAYINKKTGLPKQ